MPVLVEIEFDECLSLSIMDYKPPKPPLRLKSAPRYAQVYWCDFSISNVLPEFDDVHPVVVIRSGQKLDQLHLVLPMTTRDHAGDTYAYRLPENPNPKKPDRQAWVICNQIYTVASERLWPMRDRYNNEQFPSLSSPTMQAIGRLVRRALTRIITDSLVPPAPSKGD